MNTFIATVKGELKEFKIAKPTLADIREAQKVYNRAYNDALNSDAIIRIQLEEIMRKKGLWGDAEQTKFLSLQSDIKDLEYKLTVRGIKLSQAKEIALKIIELRNDMSKLLANRRVMDNNTAEGQAENMQFNYLVSACTVYSDGSKIFNSLEEFLQSDEEELVEKACTKFMEMKYGITASDNDLPEYNFLKKYKFIDEKLRFIDKQGRLCDKDGRLVDENGNYIDELNNLVDVKGRKIDEKGNYLDVGNFLDDDGNPIVEEVQDSGKEVVDVSVAE